jgi:hypothetical protein
MKGVVLTEGYDKSGQQFSDAVKPNPGTCQATVFNFLLPVYYI